MRCSPVNIIGGPPRAGKTTLGLALAARIGGTSVTIDDLVTFAQSFTTPEQRPDLWLMHGVSYIEYFTQSPPEQLRSDAERQHTAVWPAIQRLINRRTNKATVPLVLDGWHVRPHRVATLDQRLNVRSFWIHIDPDILEARERANTGFFDSSPDPERMFRNFMSRSLWINTLLRDEAAEHGLPILEQRGDSTVEQLCEQIIGEGVS